MSNIEDMLVPDNWNMSQSIIKVIGVGGGGCNAVSEMYRQGIKDVEFMICNTDIQSLKISQVPETLRLGSDLTKGLGAGCNPERGRKAATESIDDIRKSLNGNTEMVFITAGMGGGTGTGAAPVIAQVAKEMGKLTVAVVTLPFRDEGQEFIKRAVIGIKELQKHVDSLLIIDNQKLYQVFGELTIFEAFPRADEVLGTAVKSIAEIITRPGFINVDFADVRMVMSDSGMAIMGMGEAEGPDRAIDAVRRAFESPLLNDCDLTTAKGVLVNITSSKEDGGLTMAELSQIMEYVNSYTGCAEKFKRGVVFDPNIGKKISVTIVATGFDMHNLPQINIEDEDNNAVPLGESGIYTGLDRVEKNAKPIEIEETTNHYKEESHNHSVLENEPYIKREGKPALIIEPGEDINKLEREPAYLRRKK
jgi:cell division protein FtsZ